MAEKGLYERRKRSTSYWDDKAIDPSKEECIHHWVIEESHDHTSVGICKFCHVEQTFDNSFRDRDWRTTR